MAEERGDRRRGNRGRDERDERRDETQEEQGGVAVAEEGRDEGDPVADTRAVLRELVQQQVAEAVEGEALPGPTQAPPDLAGAKAQAERLATEERRLAGELKELIVRWIGNEATGEELDEAKGELERVAGQRRVAELTFEALRERNAGQLMRRAQQAKGAMDQAIKDFLEGRIDAERLGAVREVWAQVQRDAEALGLNIDPKGKVRVGGGGNGVVSRRGGPRGTGQRRNRVLRTNAAGDLIYRMKDPSFAHLQEVVEDADGFDDVIDRLAHATPQSKERHAVLLSREQAERIKPLLQTHINDLDDEDEDEKAFKRQFGLLLRNVDEFLESAHAPNRGGGESDDEDDSDEDEDED